MAWLGLNIDYNLAMIRGEEQQLLSNPPGVAKTYPPVLQKLAGYTRRAARLGYFGDLFHPAEALRKASGAGSNWNLEPIDWAREAPLATREWAGHRGVNAKIAAAHQAS
jgi:hypothetical protein